MRHYRVAQIGDGLTEVLRALPPVVVVVAVAAPAAAAVVVVVA